MRSTGTDPKPTVLTGCFSDRRQLCRDVLLAGGVRLRVAGSAVSVSSGGCGGARSGCARLAFSKARRIRSHAGPGLPAARVNLWLSAAFRVYAVRCPRTNG